MTQFTNNLKTVGLMGLMFGLILAGGYIIGGTNGLMIAVVLGGGMNFIAFFFSDTIAIKSMRGKEVDRSSAPDLVAMVERLAKNADLPMPRYVLP